MGHSSFDTATRHHPAWNAGKNVGTKRPLTQKQIRAIRFHLDREGRLRDRTLFDLAIDSKLRGCDLESGGTYGIGCRLSVSPDSYTMLPRDHSNALSLVARKIVVCFSLGLSR